MMTSEMFKVIDGEFQLVHKIHTKVHAQICSLPRYTIRLKHGTSKYPITTIIRTYDTKLKLYRRQTINQRARYIETISLAI